MPIRTTFLDYDARRDPKTPYHCVKCQKDLKPGQPHRLVHLVNGGIDVLHPDDEPAYVPDGADLGFSAVGMDCASKIGLEWTHDPAALPEIDAAVCGATPLRTGKLIVA